MNLRKVLFSISSVYLVLLLISIVLMVTTIPRFEDVGHVEQGCYFTDAMVSYVQCRGFFGHSIVKFILNMPYQLIYLPMFGVLGFIRAPWLIFLAILAWAPIVYFMWHVIKQPNKSLNQIGANDAPPG